jgi:hypothetical protein
MAQLEPIDLTQNEDNALTIIGNQQRKILFPKNDFNLKNEYSAVNPDALSTSAGGDGKGKGTGGDLDIYNTGAGDNTDIIERKKETVINKYSLTKNYPDF